MPSIVAVPLSTTQRPVAPSQCTLVIALPVKVLADGQLLMHVLPAQRVLVCMPERVRLEGNRLTMPRRVERP